MVYRAVGDKIMANLASLKLPINKDRAKSILNKAGFLEIDFSITPLARSLVGRSQYHRGAQFHQAPDVVDCSGLVRWIYAQIGIWLPRHSIDQRDYGRRVSRPQEGDLVFISGRCDYYWNDPANGVGHVGIVTNDGTVIHASGKEKGVIESGYKEFCSPANNFRGLRRYLPPAKDRLLLQMTGRKVEISQELRWRITQRL